MTDRELLEAAARVAGIVGHWENNGPRAGLFLRDYSNPSVWKRWHPLADDGDALRLAVKLGLHVCTRVNAHVTGFCGVDVWEDATGKDDTGKAAATRRAIVHAAAALSEKYTETPNGSR